MEVPREPDAPLTKEDILKLSGALRVWFKVYSLIKGFKGLRGLRGFEGVKGG